VRVTFLIAATVITAGWLGACSKPSSRNAQKVAPRNTESARHITLPGESSSDDAVASDLEARRPVKLKQEAPRSQQDRNATAASPLVEGLLTAAVPVHVMSMPARSTVAAEQPLDLVPVPVSQAAAAEPSAGDAVPAEGSTTGYHGHEGYGGGYHGSSYGGNSGPAIIIRGGLGGTDDKCDLRPRGYRGGIAINRMAPAFGGYGRGIR
jgi:hypothetical protein